jgi:hypothetical protein
MEGLRILDSGRCDLNLGALAHHIKLPLKDVFIRKRPAAYKNLLDVGLRTSRHAADRGSFDRRIPPAKHRQSFLAHNAFQNTLTLQALMFLHRQKRHSHAISAGRRQVEAQLDALPHKELVWDLEENAGAVAGLGIASAGPAMPQVEQHLDSLVYDVVTFVAANVGYESDPASVVLLRRMVQTLGGWRNIRIFPTRRHRHLLRHTPPLADQLFMSGDFARKGYGGPCTSAQEHTSSTY